jgi:imidazolonepropionase-like amidohydrolase
MRRLALVFGVLLLVLLLAVYVVAFRPVRNPHPPPYTARGTLAIQNAKIYTSPDAPPIERGTILIQDGRIAAVGVDIAVPTNAQILPCGDCVVTAGFWNAHIHFTERKWANSDWQPAAKLNAQLADMLSSRGFTTVVDVGSNLRDTIPVRRRIESGELLGPAIYTAGSALYPPNGIPYYLKGTLPSYILRLLPQPSTPAEAAKIEERNIAEGADVLKLFTGSIVEPHKILPMPEANARAAVEVAHRHGQLAFAHPSDLAGVLVG